MLGVDNITLAYNTSPGHTWNKIVLQRVNLASAHAEKISLYQRIRLQKAKDDI